MSFFPVSAPTHVFAPVAESVVGRPDPATSVKYQIRRLTPEEAPLYPPPSEALQAVLNSRAGVKDLTSATPRIPKGITSSSPPFPSSARADFDRRVREAALRILRGEYDSIDQILGDNPTEEVAPTNDVASIHTLGENRSDVLNRAEVDEQQLVKSVAATANRVGLDSLQTPAESAQQNRVFNLSTVFDPSNVNDVELFGFSSSDDESSNSEDQHPSDRAFELGTSEFSGGLKGGDSAANDALDAELDAFIGESYGIIGDLRNLRRTRAREDHQQTAQAHDVWAAVDSVDVSDFGSLVPDMAIDYPFSLDTFQKRAVYRLERDESVFVAAHTSAGKTVVAEYAIALALARKTKVVYTAPIKTLSNQKFRDFCIRFGHVGIITGDVSINPDANCLIMTTEILRSMLYKGADLIRDISHVIFDECHWLNDPERGVVWEEAIILLPPEVTIVMLSATVPNAMEFAKWVGRTKKKPVYVESTYKRPVPLSHQIFVKNEVYALFDSSQGRFLQANYRRAATHHKESTKNANIRFGGGRNHAWMPLIKYLKKHQLDPAIFFCFSKKKCDEAAAQLVSQDLTDGATDKNQVHMFYQSSISRLSAHDRNVPQVARHREMLKRGIGVHHAGILPIIKEITEVLFQKGLVRVLFATETFAMGVNMPARTVVFTGIHKHDGQSFRLLEPGEYVQMAGRAGRRGLDAVGTVLLYPSAADFPTESDVKAVVTGTPKALRSQFRLTYNMILNLLRIDELRVEDVMARSFGEAPAGRTSNTVKKLVEKGGARLKRMQGNAVELERFRELFHLSSRLDVLSGDIGKTIAQEGKNVTMKTFGVGRVVLVKGKGMTFRVAVVVKGARSVQGDGGLSLKMSRGPSLGRGSGGSTDNAVKVKIVVLHGGPAVKKVRTPYCEVGLTAVDTKCEGKQMNVGGLIVEIVDVGMEKVHEILSMTMEVDERGIVPIRGEPKAGALSAVAEKLRDIAANESIWRKVASVHVRKDLGMQNVEIGDMWQERGCIVEGIKTQSLKLADEGATGTELNAACRELKKEATLEKKLEMLRVATSDESLHLMPDYRHRVEVLQRLGYISGTRVRLKGRAACEVNTCPSMILTELVFEQVLQHLEPVDLAAVLSALVFTERLSQPEAEAEAEAKAEAEAEADEAQAEAQAEAKADEAQAGETKTGEPQMGGTRAGGGNLGRSGARATTGGNSVRRATEAMVGVVHGLGSMQAACGVHTSGAEYVRSHVRLGLMRGVKLWASGRAFADVCALYDGLVAEGSMVRTIVRLCELLRELRNVARVIADPALGHAAEQAVMLCKRDVIFAASLYVQ